MRTMLLSLTALVAFSAGAAEAGHAAPLGTMIDAPLTAAAPQAPVQTVQYYGYGYGRPGYYYHHHWRRWHHWHHWHHGY